MTGSGNLSGGGRQQPHHSWWRQILDDQHND